MKRRLFSAVLVLAVAATVVPVLFAAGVVDPGVLAHFGLVDFGAVMLAGAALPVLRLDTRQRELYEKRENLVTENGTLLDRIGKETDAPRRKELELEWDKRDNDIVALDKDIERIARQAATEAAGAQRAQERRSGRPGAENNVADLEGEEVDWDKVDEATREKQKKDEKRYMRFLKSALLHGDAALTPEARAVVRGRYRKMDADEQRIMEKRDGLSTANASGGYGIPALFFNELQINMKAYGGVREVSRILTTKGGQSLPIPTFDNTSNKAQIISEGSSLASPNDVAWGQVTCATFMYRSFLPVTLELMQDSAFDLEQLIRDALVEQVARGTNTHYTTGNGTTQPKGFVVAASSGVTGSSATSISTDDLDDLEHSIDPAYRKAPGVRWMMNDGTLKVLKKLKDSQNRPLWVSGYTEKAPDSINGYPYVINQDMADVQASNKSLAFGDFGRYLIRDVDNMLIVRANELLIGTGQIGFYIFSRHGGVTLDPGNDPIKVLTHPSP